MMTTATGQTTAKIYQFPIRARAAGGRLQEDAKFAVDRISPHIHATDFGGGWYHEAAIAEAEQSPKPQA